MVSRNAGRRGGKSLMRSYRNLCNAVYWLAITLWVSVLMAGAVAATGVFSKLLHTDLALSDYQSFDHAEHGRLLAGMTMEPIFTFVDMAQIAAAALALLTLALQLTVLSRGPEWKRPSNLVRAGCIIAAILLLSFRMLTITPTMNRDLRAYWHAAQVGDVAQANEHRLAFDRNHPIVSKMYSATFVLLLIAVGASAVALGTSQDSVPPLEKPRLLNQ